MSFKSDKNKVNKIINKQIDQSFLSSQRQQLDKKIKGTYKRIDPTQTAFKGSVSLYKDNWQLMTLADNFDPPLGDPWMGAQYRNWSIEFPRFDFRLIPYLTVEMELRVAGGKIDDGIIITRISRIHLFNVENIDGQENIVKLTIIACMSFDDPNVTMPYEAKLLIGYNNPQNNV